MAKLFGDIFATIDAKRFVRRGLGHAGRAGAVPRGVGGDKRGACGLRGVERRDNAGVGEGRTGEREGGESCGEGDIHGKAFQ